MNMRAILLIMSLIGTITLLPAQATNDEPAPNVFIPGIKQPKEINLSEIQKLIGYPVIERTMDLDGNIVFRVLIDEDGCYVRHLRPKSGHIILVEAVEKPLHLLRFTPATKDGKPVKFWVSVPFIICFK